MASEFVRTTAAMEEGVPASPDGIFRRSAAGKEGAVKTLSSIDRARRFLYDEDEAPDGNPLNVPLPPKIFHDKPKSQRINPFVAACLATCSTCTSYGLKRLCYAFVVIVVLAGFTYLITAWTKVERVETSTERVNGIMSEIVDAGISSMEQMTTEGTPQYHALHWLADVDKSNADTPFLAQRYALAVFFYSTSEDDSHTAPKAGWKNQQNWMTSKGICIWYGVECQTSENGPSFDGNGAVTNVTLASNKIEGTLPSELIALEDLLYLDLSQNSISGSLPRGLSDMVYLRSLLLRDNSLGGALPKEYGSFENLRQLNLGHNNLIGKIPKELEHIVTLRALALDSNEFTGPIPDFENMIRLNTLYLDNNNLSGEFPMSITKLTSMIDFRISVNHITGTLPAEMDQLSKLEILHLDTNNFRGTIPAGIFEKVTRLNEIHLFQNEFEGELPTNFGDLRSLKHFLLAENKFTGTIPGQLGLMADLTKFTLSDNKLTGTIPNIIAVLKDLEVLRLRGNKLTGTIPSDIGSLHKLKALELESNKLTGKVPTEIGGLKSLMNMRVYENSLTGTMPNEVCNLVNEEELLYLAADCGEGEFICECCHKCF